MLIAAILCFIDQRLASFLYNQYRDQLQIHKRWFGKFFFTTLIVLCQILFDKNCTLAKKNHSNIQIEKIELSAPQPVNHTELTTFNQSTTQTPSFNLRSSQKSTPNRPNAQKKLNFAPTPSKRTFVPTLEATHTVEIHKENSHSDIEEHFDSS
jgi:hypothetical protein